MTHRIYTINPWRLWLLAVPLFWAIVIWECVK